MKDTIKNILREGTLKNSLGVTVTRPNQTLIVLRGIPGAGKSTKAKELVGDGVIHSTDDVIESLGDYNEFFDKMVANGNFAPLSNAHNTNFQNAVASMKNKITPVIIDNTNIRPDEPKNYVEAALNLGYGDNNIEFVDIGTGGLSAEELTDRNTHGVPFGKIEQMIKAYEQAGPLSLEKVLKSKSRFGDKEKKVLYSAIILSPQSIEKLQRAFANEIQTWGEENNITPITKGQAHHMTIAFGKSLTDIGLSDDIGKTVYIDVVALGKSNNAIAVKVEGYDPKNIQHDEFKTKTKHITLAYAQGSAPKASNDIPSKDWTPIKPIRLIGIVSEVTN